MRPGRMSTGSACLQGITTHASSFLSLLPCCNEMNSFFWHALILPSQDRSRPHTGTSETLSQSQTFLFFKLIPSVIFVTVEKIPLSFFVVLFLL